MAHTIIVFLAGLALGVLLFFLAYWRGIREGRRRAREALKKELMSLAVQLSNAMTRKELEAVADRLSKGVEPDDGWQAEVVEAKGEGQQTLKGS